MTHDLKITLTPDEVNDALREYATKRVDLGVPFIPDDVTIEILSVTEGAVLRLVTLSGRIAPAAPPTYEPDDIPF